MMFQVSRGLSSIFNFPRQKRSLSRWVAVLRSAPATALCRYSFVAVALACSTNSLASESYYWAENRPGAPKHSTPEQACDDLIDAIEIKNRRGNSYVTIFDRVGSYGYSVPVNSYYYKCAGTMFRSWVPNIPTSAGALLWRYGDFCADGSNANPTTGPCNTDEQKGPSNSCPSSFGGNPINFAIGNKFQDETDYSASGNSALRFSRSYNSLDGLWRHSFSTYLRFAGTQYVAVVMSNGRESFFAVSGATVTPTSADLGVLSKTDTGWQFISTENGRFTFDTTGKLTQWSNAHDAVHQFAYSGSQITVTDNLGNSLTLTEDADHQPLTLSAPGVQIAYGYDANKRLTSVTRTAGDQTTQRQFHYEDSRNTSWLTGITDERGVRYATWAYDDQGRAISSEHADGADRVSVAYNSGGTVSVTNELGKKATYRFQTIEGIKHVTAIEGELSANCPNSNSTFTYDSRGLLKTKTDNKGHLTTYDYNERGLEISRTEAAGTPQARTVTTDWHPTLFLPVTVTELSRITHYTYDDQGRQLSQSVTQR